MTIKEARGNISALLNYSTIKADPAMLAAVHLAYSALGRIDRQRHGEIPIFQPPLPGETMV